MAATWAMSPRRHLDHHQLGAVEEDLGSIPGAFSPFLSPVSSCSSSEQEDAERVSYYRQEAAREGHGKRRHARKSSPQQTSWIPTLPDHRDRHHPAMFSHPRARILGTSDERRSPSLARRSSEDSTDLFVTTLDEDDQQMFIALFYWRRKVIEAHFSAWKWMACTLRRSAKGVRRQTLGGRAGRTSDTALGPFAQPRSRRNLILKRNVSRLDAEESSSRPRAARSHDKTKTMQSFPRQGKGTGNQVKSADLTSIYAAQLPVEAYSCEKRRQFRQQLLLVYSCFSDWKVHAGELQGRTRRLLAKAGELRRRRHLKRVLQVWERECTRRGYKRLRTREAYEFHLQRVMSSTFCGWQRQWKVQCEITRRRQQQVAQQKQLQFRHWCQCIHRTKECRTFARSRQHNQLKRNLQCFRAYVAQEIASRAHKSLAISHHEARLQTLAIRLWKRAVFSSPLYLLSIDHGKRIASSTGMRRWHRFVDERQIYAHKELLADYSRYRGRLKRVYEGWSRFLHWKRQRRQSRNRAQSHYERSLKRSTIWRLDSAVRVQQAQKARIKNAFQWHQHKLLGRVFTAWASNAQLSALADRFHEDVLTRNLRSAVCAWRLHSVDSRALLAKQLLVSKYRTASLLKRYMATWFRRRHLKELVVQLRKRRENAMIVDHISAWSSLVKQRRSQREALQRLRLQKEHAMLQGVLSQWNGVSMRKRCLRRLVKLFRKKQARARVKIIFHLFRSHSQTCKLHRQMDRDRITTSFSIWKRFSRQQSEDTAALVVATQYYSLRRYALAVKRWSSFVTREVETRDLDGVAVSHYFRRLLRSSLQSWYVTAQRRRRQTEFLASRLQMLGKQAMARCMDSWHAYIQTRMERKAKEWAALQFQVDSLQRRAFTIWQAYLEARRHSKEMVIVAASIHAELLTTKVLQAWRLAARRKARLKMQSNLATNTLRHRRVQSSVRLWYHFCQEHRRRREQLVQAIRFHDEFLLCLTLFRWQEVWFRTSALRGKETKVTRRVQGRRLARAVRKWRRYHVFASRTRSHEAKAVRKYSTRLLHSHFQGWKCYHEAVRREVKRRRQTTLRLQQKVVARVFKVWRFFSIQHAIVRCQRQSALQHRNMYVLRSSFTRWQSYRSKHTLERYAEQFRGRQLQGKVMRNWQAHRAFVKKVSHYLLVTGQLLRHNLSRSTFVRWKTYVAHHQEHTKRLIWAEDHHLQQQCEKAVSRLKKQVAFKRAATQARVLLRRNVSTKCLSQWKQYAANKHEQRAQRALAVQWHHRRFQQIHFHAWKVLTRRHAQEKKSKGDALYHTACLRMAWCRWERAVASRKRMHAMDECRLARAQSAALRRWRAHALSSTKHRAATSEARVFRRVSLQRRAWKGWQKHTSLCHEKRERLAWVFGYYSIEVLQRRCLVSWKQLLVNRQIQQEKKRLAAEFNEHRLLQERYRRWKEYLKTRQANYELQESQLRMAVSMALTRSVRRWRDRIGIWRQQHNRENLASTFYQERRMTKGIQALLSWKQSRADDRKLSAQIDEFRYLQSTRTCFQRWQRYHEWRLQYEHLRRLLKHNQKEDVFARWKKYWQKRQQVDEMRLQARIFHCVHAEQRSFATWRSLVHQKKQKRRADAFAASRVLDQCFRLWRQKVLVVRRMRKLFLYQDAFRLETHFGAWKRYCAARAQLNGRLRGAMKFRDNLRQLDAWESWRSWLVSKKQEREVIQLAIGFRERFASRKSFSRWKDRVQYWKRKRLLGLQAVRCAETNLLLKSWQALAGWGLKQMQLHRCCEQLVAQLKEKRKQRAVDTLRRTCLEKEQVNARTTRAKCYWALHHQQRYWGHLMTWYSAAKKSKGKLAKATAFCRERSLQRSLVALKTRTAYSKRIEAKVSTFRLSYFRSMADDCFYQWRSFAVFKMKLRALACKTTRSRRQRRFQQWRAIACELTRRRQGMLAISAQRRQRTLAVWLNHWESVCTDRWLERELLAHHRRHAQRRRMACVAVRRWKTLLAARHERQQWRGFFLTRHSAWLAVVLRGWRGAVSE